MSERDGVGLGAPWQGLEQEGSDSQTSLDRTCNRTRPKGGAQCAESLGGAVEGEAKLPTKATVRRDPNLDLNWTLL